MKRFLNVCMALTALLMMSASVWAQEPYAVLSENNTILTFYYDGNKAARNGMGIGPFTSVYESGKGYLTTLDLSHFVTSKVIGLQSMFSNCSNLTTIFADETKWSTENMASWNSWGVFTDCTNLVGGNGTVFDESHTGLEYARIDKPGQPGYFTAKNGTSVDPGTDPNPDPGSVPDPGSFDTTFPEANVGTNRLKSITQIRSNGGEDKLELTYDDKGRVIKSVQYFDSGYNMNVCDYSYVDGKIEVVLTGLRGQTGSMNLWLKDGKVSYVAEPSSSGDEPQLYYKYEYDSSDRMIKVIPGGPEPELPAGFVYDYLPGRYHDIDWSDANPTKQTFYFLKTNGDIKIDEMGTYTYNNLTSQPIINALFSFGDWGQPCYVNSKELPLVLASYPYMGTLPKNMIQKIVWQIPGETGYELTYTYETDANGEIVKVIESYNNNLWDTYILEWENSAPIPVNPDLDPTASGSQDFDNGGGISGSSNLDGNVIGNVYYAIGSGGGGYNDVEGCIEITQPTNDSDIDGTDIFGENFRDHFTGIVFKVAPGSGVIKVNAETTGSMMLKVKVGNNLPYEMMLTGKVEAKFPYSVTEPTYVYIYASMLGSSAPNRAGASGDKLKIYGFSWQDATGITEKEMDTDADTYWYTLDGQRLNAQPTKKGVYIVNGRKVVVR